MSASGCLVLPLLPLLPQPLPENPATGSSAAPATPRKRLKFGEVQTLARDPMAKAQGFNQVSLPLDPSFFSERHRCLEAYDLRVLSCHVLRDSPITEDLG